MSIVESFAIAFSLSIDALVCAIIYGNAPYSLNKKLKYALFMALSFGFFQFLMPILGFFAGSFVSSLLFAFDHWIAFALLALVSLNMLKEAFSKSDEHKDKALNLLVLFSLSIATSIDALALGFSVSLLHQSIALLSIIIGVTCFVISYIGFCIGQFLSQFKSLECLLNILGSITLLSIGIAILVEHQVFN